MKSVVVCLCVCGHTYGRIFQPIFTKFGKSKKEELVRLGLKSENAFPYFNPPKKQFPAKY